MEAQVAELRGAGDYQGAAEAQRWLVEHGVLEAPARERGRRYDAGRLLVLADLFGKANQVAAALRTYREVLRLDAARIEDVLASVDMLPLPAEERDAYMEQFVRTAISINPQLPIGRLRRAACWRYTAREIRIRRVQTQQGPNGMERRVVYDARPWAYDDRARQWHADGDWIVEAGAEILDLRGLPNPRFQAILDADGGFLADGPVPPCHASSWSAPYDARSRSAYVARALPAP